MTTGIYKITNLINNHIYVGQSIDIKRRFREHKSENSLVVDKAIKKYGVENFSFEIIEECDSSMLDEREKYWIAFYDSCRIGYNCTYGGQGTKCSSIKLSNEDVEKIYQLLLDFEFTQNEIATRFNVSYQTISDINRGKSRKIEGYNFPLRGHNIQHEKFLQQEKDKKSKELSETKEKSKKPKVLSKTKYCCTQCGKLISKNITGLCSTCYKKTTRVAKRPEPVELAQEILESSFCAVGRKYGVSDNAIRKWCISYGMPTKKEELKQWLDNNI